MQQNCLKLSSFGKIVRNLPERGGGFPQSHVIPLMMEPFSVKAGNYDILNRNIRMIGYFIKHMSWLKTNYGGDKAIENIFNNDKKLLKNIKYSLYAFCCF